MSWAEEDWTVGLSGRVLQKVKELQIHQERLSRENKQKQLQIDNIQASLEKQTVKYEEVRGELQSVQRELQRVQDEAKAAVTTRERLSQELQTKQAQVCSLEGQLDAARTLNNKLTQEVKRLEAELEKLQNSSRSADTTLFSTPCWNTTSPWDNNGSKKEERSGQRDEGKTRGFNSRQRLHFHDVTPAPSHKSTPHRHPSDQSESFSTPSAVFPWERDDSRSAAKRRSPSFPQAPSADVINQVNLEQGGCGKERDYRRETDILQTRVSALEEELSAKAAAMKSIQNEMAQSKKDIAAKELSVQKGRDELSRAQTRMAQESERASGAEQRLKQLQEELKCERKNAESSRLQHQQRLKDLEKQHQRDLADLQKERQYLEKQHQQEVNKLNQELQQARTLHNALQAQLDKLSLQKQALDKELGTLKEKLKWTEGQLQESQKKESQTQAKLTEALHKAEGVAVSLEQSRKKERSLEEEGRRLADELANALRNVKELEEQKAVAAPPVQPVQFCPVGQSFSPQPSYSRHSQHPTHIKSTAAMPAEQKRAEIVEKKKGETSSSYPSDREPGEGIDSEHIIEYTSSDSECLQRVGNRKHHEEFNRSKNESYEGESCGKGKPSTFDHVDSTSPHSTDETPTNSRLQSSEQPSEDLKRENAALRSELNDAREELQKRLDDLEVQRRAEAEARTRLKQLSRKHANQSVEKEEQDKEWKAQLEREKAETEKLRKAMAALEADVQREKEEREKKKSWVLEEEKNKALEDRESEMIELNIQLKKQVAEVKSQLALEREERAREAEERSQQTHTDIDVKKELTMKLEELQAELEELKNNRKDYSPQEAKVSVTNSPLMYLTLCDDELNSNMVSCNNSLLPSPEQHLLFCQATNQHNMLVSQTTADLMQEEATIMDLEHSPQMASDPEDTRNNYLVGYSLTERLKTQSDIHAGENASSDLAAEVERLRKENAREVERAKQYQMKLEALQSQVTLQTKQLTMAFDKQSQHISGLLVELREKERALLSQEEVVQRYKQEIDTLKTHKEGEDNRGREEMILKESNTQSNIGSQEIGTRDAQKPEPATDNRDSEAQLSKDQLSGSNTHKIVETQCTQDKATADVTAELLSLRQENQLLKKNLLVLNISKTGSSLISAENKIQEEQVQESQNTGGPALPCVNEQSEPADTTAVVSQLQNVMSCEKESEREKRRTEEELEALYQPQINQLQQQVVELKKKLKALSAESQQQAEELAVWRLASQTAPIFELQDEVSILSQSQSIQQTTGEMTQSQGLTSTIQPPHQAIQENHGSVAIIREDELLLSCSSNKLQGHMLITRLQQSNTSESNSLHPSKKTTARQRHSWATAKIDKDPEKENWEINSVSDICEKRHKEEMDTEVVPVSSDTSCPCVTTDSTKVSRPKQTKTAKCPMGNAEVITDVSRASKETIATSDPSGRDIKPDMKSVSSQTEDHFYPTSAPAASELLCASTQTEEVEAHGEDELVESPPLSPVPLPEGTESEEKMLFSASFPIPADPARLAERIRRNRTQLSAAFDDTEYEPYGLPEVVMKGFADIPSGPSCPYIVRRGLLGTVVPVSQKDHSEETD